MLKILLVEDDPTDARLTQITLDTDLSEPFELTHVTRLGDALPLVANGRFDVALLDLTLPDSMGIDTFRQLKEQSNRTPITVLSGMADVDMTVQAVREGAQDYLEKAHIHDGSLGRVVRFAVERSRRREAENVLHAAEEVQKALYPQNSPNVPGFDIAGVANPAAIGCGDYFDFIPMPDGALLIALGDVSGHGLRAGLRMIEARSLLRARADTSDDPGKLLSDVNRLFDPIHEMGHFIAMILLHLSPDDRTIRFACAGHPGHLLRGDDISELNTRGIPIGIDSTFDVPTSDLHQLEPGDVILLATDGLIESASEDGTYFGSPRMLSLLRENRELPAERIISLLCDEAEAHRGPDRQQIDDITLVAIKVLAR